MMQNAELYQLFDQQNMSNNVNNQLIVQVTF